MALFVVKHQHTEETCPARNPEMGEMLIDHLSPANAESYGVNIQNEAVIDGKHTFYLIVSAESEQKVQKFMTPFSQAGSVEVMPASLCEVVVDRGSC